MNAPVHSPCGRWNCHAIRFLTMWEVDTMRAIEAFIFDLDGVLTDTAEYHYRAWKQLADEEGLPFTREDNEHLRGVSRRQSLLLLLKGRTLPEEQMENWMARKNEYYRTSLVALTPNDL